MDDFGHWEADLVVGGHKWEKGYVLTLIEKKSRYGITLKFVSKNPHVIVKGIGEILKRFDQGTFKSTTFDHGMAFPRCPKLEAQFPTSIAFTHPYSSWERGQSENDHGMMWRWYPKGTNFNHISQRKLNEVTCLINDMPRDILGWRSAAEVFNEFMKMNGYKMYN